MQLPETVVEGAHKVAHRIGVSNALAGMTGRLVIDKRIRNPLRRDATAKGDAEKCD